VENAATLAALKAHGVDYAQGYYLGRPKPLPPKGARRKLKLPEPKPRARRPPSGLKAR
jgi:EAL domain-containing protein (putative c-di-GMP-specific phosphodiesterase class I)